MRRALKLYLIAVGALLVLTAGTLRMLRPGGGTSGVSGPAGDAVAAPDQTPPARGPGHPVLLFFADPGGEGLVARRSDVHSASDPTSQAAATLLALFRGPEEATSEEGQDAGAAIPLPAVPPGVELRAIFFDGKGTATVDLGRLAAVLGPGGSEAEVLALWAVVDTLAFNFPAEARRVRILLDGQEVESLGGGHVSLAEPLTPRRDLVAGEIPRLSAVRLSGGEANAPGNP